MYKKRIYWISVFILSFSIVFSLAISIKNYRMKSKIQMPILDSYQKVTSDVTKDVKIEENFNKYEETYIFFSTMFGIDNSILKKEIESYSLEDFNELDLLNTNKDNTSFDLALLVFIENLQKEKPDLFKREYIYEVHSKDYIYNLIEYFCYLYPLVDVQTAKAIARIETGNLNAKSMMKKNNIFGGMSNGKLVSYSSIEYGVYRYIRLLNNSYYKKGLTTVETIGYKYNPTIIDGVKVANPTWVSNVNHYRNSFLKDIIIDSVEKLVESNKTK